MAEDSGIGSSYSFSYTTHAVASRLDEEPEFVEPISTQPSEETIPLSAFSKHASAMQAIARYLVDVRKLAFADAARRVGRAPKSLWMSYHQTTPLPELEESLAIPLSIFTGKLAPLEALVTHLKQKGLRNVEIAATLRLDPKTTWTAAKRGEAKR